MAEYIEREELMKFPIRRNHYDKEHGNEDFICGIETVLEYAENLPTVDAVPVVRCKDCKYFKTWLCQNEDNSDNWFCADGERKDGDDNG